VIPFPQGLYSSNAVTVTGPGDVVTSGWICWYGLRAFSAAVAATGTQKAVTVRRASDNTTADILILTTGRLDIATLTTFLTSTTGFVTEWYDQTGNGFHCTQSTTSKQPQILTSGGPGTGNPSVKFVGSSSQCLFGVSNPTISQNSSASWVAERTGTFTSTSSVITTGGNQNTGFFSTANQTFLFAGFSATQSAADSAWHAFNATLAGGSSPVNIDGTISTGSVGSDTANGVVSIGANNGASQFLTGNIVECGRNTTQFTNPTQLQLLNTNQHGTTGWNF
jgi:hypothetical protein